MQAMAGSSRERGTVQTGARLFSKTTIQFFLGIAILMLPVTGHAQALLSSNTVLAEAPLPTFSKDVQEVSLILTVTNKHGRFVRDLNLKDLAILDNNLPPERITYFQSETDLPLRVA